MDNKEIQAKLLYALANPRKWGESHTAYEHMFRYVRNESLGKHGLKLAKKVADDLMREGLVLQKPTHYGLQVSLNPRRAQEIKQIIIEMLGVDF